MSRMKNSSYGTKSSIILWCNDNPDKTTNTNILTLAKVIRSPQKQKAPPPIRFSAGTVMVLFSNVLEIQLFSAVLSKK